MQTKPDFLGAVLAAPSADEPRRVYADWLDVRCDPLGEFIRVQLLLARLPERDPRLIELERRERELLSEFESEWTADFAHFVDWWVFRRGFVQEVSMSVWQFLTHGQELLESAPVREVHLTQVREDLGELAGCPELGRMKYLDLSNNPVREGGMRTLAGSPHLSGMRGMNLSCTGLGDGGARALAGATHLNQIEELYLSNNRIGSAGARMLAEAPHLDRLQTLFLRDNYMDAHCEQALYRRFGSRVHF